MRRKTISLVLLVAVLSVMLCAVFSGCRGEAETYSEQFSLRLEDENLVVITDADRVDEIKAVLSSAEDIGFVPKTYILGPTLVYTGTEGQETSLELDMDGDLFRYDGRFFDYGPGNDNNALPVLLNQLGLEDWPEVVKAAYPEWFASLDSNTVPVITGDTRQTVYMDLWYPDWYYVKLREEHALVILEALKREAPAAVEQEKLPVEESEFTIHIAYDDGREYDLACVENGDFLIWECGTDKVYGFSDPEFRKTVDEMIALSKKAAE